MIDGRWSIPQNSPIVIDHPRITHASATRYPLPATRYPLPATRYPLPTRPRLIDGRLVRSLDSDQIINSPGIAVEDPRDGAVLIIREPRCGRTDIPGGSFPNGTHRPGQVQVSGLPPPRSQNRPDDRRGLRHSAGRRARLCLDLGPGAGGNSPIRPVQTEAPEGRSPIRPGQPDRGERRADGQATRWPVRPVPGVKAGDRTRRRARQAARGPYRRR